MTLELTIFILRLLAGLSLAGFLLALFFVIWRNLSQVEQALAPLGSKHGYLVREAPPPAGDAERWSLRPIVTLGRAGSNAIIVNDDFASAEHARIMLDGGKWWLEDRGSRNGTRLNGDIVTRRTILADGDLIGIGSYRYKIHLNV